MLAMTKLDNVLKRRDITLLTKVCIVKTMFFSPSSHIWMWELDCKEVWVPKNWCFQIMVLEKTLESPLDNKGIKPVNPTGNQPWIFIGRTDAEAEAPILWPPMWRTNSLKKTWCQDRLMAGEEGVDREWGVWMASLNQWTWVSAHSGN